MYKKQGSLILKVEFLGGGFLQYWFCLLVSSAMSNFKVKFYALHPSSKVVLFLNLEEL